MRLIALSVLLVVAACCCSSVCSTSHSSTEVAPSSTPQPREPTTRRSPTEELEDTFRVKSLGLVTPRTTTPEEEEPEADSSEEKDSTPALDMLPPRENAPQRWGVGTTKGPAVEGVLMIRIVEAISSKEHPDQVLIRDHSRVLPFSQDGIFARPSFSTPRPRFPPLRVRNLNTQSTPGYIDQDDAISADKQSVFSDSPSKDGSAFEDDLEGAHFVYPGVYPALHRSASASSASSKRPIRSHLRFW